MPDEKDCTELSPSDITAIRSAYTEMLKEYPDRYRNEKAKEELATAVMKALGRSISKDSEEVVALLKNV